MALLWTFYGAALAGVSIARGAAGDIEPWLAGLSGGLGVALFAIWLAELTRGGS